MDKDKTEQIADDVVSSADVANFIVAALYIRKASHTIYYNDRQLSDGLISLAKMILDKTNIKNLNIADDIASEITKQ